MKALLVAIASCGIQCKLRSECVNLLEEAELIFAEEA